MKIKTVYDRICRPRRREGDTKNNNRSMNNSAYSACRYPKVLTSSSSTSQEGFNHTHHVSIQLFVGQPLAVTHAEHLHALVIFEVREQLWCNQEVLSAVGTASYLHERVMHCPFVLRVHSLKLVMKGGLSAKCEEADLVDLIHQGEGRTSEFSQAHEIHDRRERSFLWSLL